MPQNLKPTPLLLLEKGKLYSDQRDRAELEPKPEKRIMPRCPQRFNKDERRAWKQIAAVLKNYGLFTAANAIKLELLSTAWAQYIDVSQKLIDNPGIIIKGPQNNPMYNPYFNAQHKLGLIIDRYTEALGLSSIALAKIGSLALKAKQKSKMEDMLD